jgi:hypothetical protein
MTRAIAFAYLGLGVLAIIYELTLGNPEVFGGAPLTLLARPWSLWMAGSEPRFMPTAAGNVMLVNFLYVGLNAALIALVGMFWGKAVTGTRR